MMRNPGSNQATACACLAAALLLTPWSARLAKAAPATNVPHARTSGAIASFDVPGAGTGYAQGTMAIAINASGTVAGGYLDDNTLMHGFLLSPQGSFTTFDAPGAEAGTFVAGFDDSGTVIGTYVDAANVTHGFARAPDGSFSILTGRRNIDLGPRSIAPNGHITGAYTDMNGLGHGFSLSPKGHFLSYEVAGSGILSGQGSYGDAINDVGQIGGIYVDLSGGRHPYVRTKAGSVVTLVPPGNFVSGFGYEFAPLFVRSIAINAHGAVAGDYFQPIQGNPFGGAVNVFIQSATGPAITFGIGDSGCCTFTYVTGLNFTGVAIGYDNDYYNLNHGYVRTPDGTITTFDAPGAGTQYYQGTLPAAINAAGVITGLYQDENYVWHGFIRQP